MRLIELLAQKLSKSKGPLPPNDPTVMFMTADQGPFKCGHCIFFEKLGQPCPWQTKVIKDLGDCCGRYWSVDNPNVPAEYIPFPGWRPKAR